MKSFRTRLIEYWAREKIVRKSGLTYFYDCQNQQAQSQEKIIEIAKYHEERGKIKCKCWQCAEKKRIRKEIERQWDREEAKSEERDC